MNENVLVVKSYDLACNIVDLYKGLIDQNEYVLSKQILRSGTSVGANVRESQNAQSRKDFMHKLAIAQKECAETLYWIDLLFYGQFISMELKKALETLTVEVLKILKRILITMKST